MTRSRLLLVASVALTALFLAAGCPTDNPPDDNSNSSVNDNGSSDNSNGSGGGSTDNSNSGGSSNENGSDNSNSGGSSNENTNSAANENSNSANSNDNGDSTGASIIATWGGTLSCERTQAFAGGGPGTPTTSTQSLAITFGSDNKPTNIVVNGYSSVPNQTVTLKNVGDTVTNNVSASGYAGTMQMTISSVDYRSDRCEIVIDIVLQMTATANPAATQNGTGQQTISARTTGTTGLDYTAETDYEVRLQSGSIEIDTTENKICTGTLVK